MSIRTRRTSVTCTACQTSADLPENRDHRGLWAAGWRWLGTLDLFSCPACPPVVVVDENGRHRRGPGCDQAPRTGAAAVEGSAGAAA